MRSVQRCSGALLGKSSVNRMKLYSVKSLASGESVGQQSISVEDLDSKNDFKNESNEHNLIKQCPKDFVEFNNICYYRKQINLESRVMNFNEGRG